MRLEVSLPLDMPPAWGGWLSTQSPALPSAAALPWAWHAAWAVVLAALAVGLAARLPRVARAVLGGAVLLWTLAGGAWSPAFALGLVFQAPSLMLVLLCARALFRAWGATAPGQRSASGPAPLVLAGGLCAVLLGWALLLDSFALLPLQLYAWGFSRASLLVVVGVLGALWLLRGMDAPGLGGCLLVTLLLFVLLRWPSGNLWDALLDPLLWLWLQCRGLWWLLRGRVLSAPPAAPATRA